MEGRIFHIIRALSPTGFLLQSSYNTHKVQYAARAGRIARLFAFPILLSIYFVFSPPSFRRGLCLSGLPMLPYYFVSGGSGAVLQSYMCFRRTGCLGPRFGTWVEGRE